MIVLSSDSKYLFNVQGCKIKVQNITSGETVFDLNYENKNVESICLNPQNRYQLLSFHSGGYICLWDFEDGVLLKNYKTKLLIKKVLNIDNKQNLFALVKLENEEDKYSFYRLDFSKSNDDLHKSLLLDNIEFANNHFDIQINQKETFIAFIQGKKHLCVFDLKRNQLKKHSNRNELTCLALHSNEDCIATGTQCGKILIWYNFFADDEPTKTTLHWHCLPVMSLCFTTEGSHLLSGGHECVLVKWMYKTGHKDFKPRLGSQIKEIKCSRDNTIYALEHFDNTFHILDSTNYSIIQTFTSFTKPFNLTKNGFPAGLSYFKPLNCLVTNSKPGHLQFYQPTNDKLLFHLDIVEENYISPENLDRPKIHTEIEHVVFNFDYTWMATVERRDDQETTPEIKLKFWHFDKNTSKFSLNTIIRLPHSYFKINKMKFDPKENLLVTVGDDTFFKTWILLEDSKQSSWVYDTCNAYRHMVPGDVDFSPSGKLLAVSYGHIVTIWNNESMDLIDELINCDSNDKIRQLTFESNEYLICIHETSFNVWSIEKGLCVWSKNTQIDIMERHPVNGSILAFYRSPKSVHIAKINAQEKILDLSKEFNVSIDEPLSLICSTKAEEDDPLNDKNRPIEFLDDLNIYYCDNRKHLQRFNLSSQFDDISMIKLANKLKQNLPTNNLATIFSQHKSQKFVDSTNRVIDNFSTQENFKKINSTPAYLLPRVTLFGYETLRAMMGYQRNNKIENNDDIEMKEDDTNELYQNNGEFDSSDDDEIEQKENRNNKKIQNFSIKANQLLDQEKYENFSETLKKYSLDDFLLNFTK